MKKDKYASEIINQGFKEAFETINHFYDLLGLDPTLYNHLSTINLEPMTQVTQDPDENKNLGSYIPETFTIQVNTENGYQNLVTTLVHEMIHAIRTVMLPKGIHVNRFENPNTIKCLKYPMDEYDSLKESLLSRTDIQYPRLVPIKVRDLGNHFYTVIAYDQESPNTYYYYEEQQFETSGMQNIDAFTVKLGQELEQHVPTDTLHYESQINGTPGVVSYFDYKRTKIKNEDEQFEMEGRIECQDCFEEVLTETLALLMMECQNKQTLNLEDVINTMLQKETSYDLQTGLVTFKTFGVDMLRWFLTATFGEYYEDYFENAFANEDEYLTFLAKFSTLYYYETNALLFGIDKSEVMEAKNTILNILQTQSKKDKTY